MAIRIKPQGQYVLVQGVPALSAEQKSLIITPGDVQEKPSNQAIIKAIGADCAQDRFRVGDRAIVNVNRASRVFMDDLGFGDYRLILEADVLAVVETE